MEVTPPSSFDDDSDQAGAAKEQYPMALGVALEMYDWSFARKVQVLPLLAAYPAGDVADPELPYAASLPSDFLRMQKVYDERCFAWRIDEQLLRMDRNAPVTIRYTRQITREKYLQKTFQLLVAYQLAVLLMPRFVKTRSKRREIKDDLLTTFGLAKLADKNSAKIGRIDGQPDQGDWVTEAKRR